MTSSRSHPLLTVLNDPIQDKGTAYTEKERDALGITGLLPAHVDTLETQLSRVMSHLDAKQTDLERYIYLIGLCDRNETLYFAVLMSDPERFIPIVYNPTIAEACLDYGQIFRRPRGMYLTKHTKGRLKEVLSNWPTREIRFICITSGGRILGLGDIGANGTPIPIGKLHLYTACAGVPPDALLPIHMDIGTTNRDLRDDPLYPGLHEDVASSDEIDALMDEFMQAATEVFPGVCIHFEDWKGTDALRLFDRYKDDHLIYNDDIQGTAGVTIAGLITALQIKDEALKDQRVMFAGAGSAAIGIANMIVEAMKTEGLSGAEAQAAIALFDAGGLLTVTRDDLNIYQTPYARDLKDETDLQAAVKAYKPTILIGVSTVGGLFTEAVVKEMASHCDRPVIFPLSNPTHSAECTPKDAYTWTDGKALVACGVQFPDVEIEGQTFHPGQANNFYIFPALGLAVYATKAKTIDDKMFIAAARGCADQVSAHDRQQGMLFPRQRDMLNTETRIAIAIARDIFDRGLAGVEEPEDVGALIQSQIYQPVYHDETV
ncbi:NAD-dependent malic enzyme [Sagittula stellata]|uniref:Malic enzyme n=1 Tax=Sagittula stellata (strain ATCC 700073 / DSM 11524 / E-37) TaxID=388399 RepID=A3K376_SAGS3|nr:NAD-dependent malic enzyme [Sagittula stellata]EBA08635.1 malic enzyme [Sagittula stellata E-37]